MQTNSSNNSIDFYEMVKELSDAFREFSRYSRINKIEMARRGMKYRIKPNNRFYWKTTVEKVAEKYGISLNYGENHFIGFEVNDETGEIYCMRYTPYLFGMIKLCTKTKIFPKK